MKGYRFHPTDEELVNYYLHHKNLGHESEVSDAINEINICHFDPWDLPGQSRIQSDDLFWYFFTSRTSKYRKGNRANRRTKNGYWKATGKDRKIRGKNQEVIGSKKTLVFYKGRFRNCVRTAWVMHEYFCSFVPVDQGSYVICKVKRKLNGKGSISCSGGGEQSHPPASSPEDRVGTEDHVSIQAEPLERSRTVSRSDVDLVLHLKELDEGVTSMSPPEIGCSESPPGSKSGSSFEEQEDANAVEAFVTSVLTLDNSSNDNIETHNMQPDVAADNISNRGPETVFSGRNAIPDMQPALAAKLEDINNKGAETVLKEPNEDSPIYPFGQCYVANLDDTSKGNIETLDMQPELAADNISSRDPETVFLRRNAIPDMQPEDAKSYPELDSINKKYSETILMEPNHYSPNLLGEYCFNSM